MLKVGRGSWGCRGGGGGGGGRLSLEGHVMLHCSCGLLVIPTCTGAVQIGY